MKVLILSVTAGYGHHATANAISDALKQNGAIVHTMDVYEYINKLVKETIDKGYLFTSKHTQELYRIGYLLAENHGSGYFTANLSFINIVNALGAQKFAKIIEQLEPDIVICTHIFAAQLMNHMKKHELLNMPTIGIITDYTIHPFWENVSSLEHVVLASDLLIHRAIKKGIAKDCILDFGIPINPKFNHFISKSEACKLLGIDEMRPSLLMMGGSMGYSDNKDIIQSLNQCDIPFEVIVVCGNNKKQYDEMVELANLNEGICTLHPYGFVDNVDVMMSAVDCIITKPGGLTVTEALAKNLPMILVNPIPGHEERNIEFLINNGMAMVVSKTYTLDDAVENMFNNCGRRDRIRDNMNMVAKPDAVKRLAEFVINYKAI